MGCFVSGIGEAQQAAAAAAAAAKEEQQLHSVAAAAVAGAGAIPTADSEGVVATAEFVLAACQSL
jgi:4-hydroxy-3-methylbut-2-en-1-yl diphosphate synthase IspG/GcpE